MKEKVTAIVLAAGAGSRMNPNVRKQFLFLGGKQVLFYSLDCFERTPFIDEIVIVTTEDAVEYCRRNIVRKFGFKKVKKIVTGGAQRYDSVYAGLKACEDADYVMVHDGARPFIDPEMLESGLEAARKIGAATIGVPVKETVKILSDDSLVQSTPQRSTVWNIQTPQIFHYPLLRHAHEAFREHQMSGITDDCMLVENLGHNVKVVEGSYDNIKLTTPEDLFVAESILERHPWYRSSAINM